MQKELNKKLKLDSINWVEVIEGLEGKTTFEDHDIKRALRKTGRSFNNNGPFHAVVKSFIETLGNTVSSTMSSSKMIYTITSTEDALKAVDCKRKAKKSTGIDYVAPRPKTVATKPEVPAVPDEDKIKDLFKRSYSAFEHAIYLLAVYVKHAETTLSSKIIKTEMAELGVNYNTLVVSTKPTVLEIYKRLGLNQLVIKKSGLNSFWKLEGQKDILDEYTHLCEVYEKLTGKKFKNLDDYVTTPTSKKEVERRFEILKELEEKSKHQVREPRVEKDQEIVWKKWLLVLASKNSLGASRSLSSLVSWVRTQRHYEIGEEEAERLYREMMVDTESELQYQSSGYISMSEKAWKTLSKHYSPAKINETIFVKLPISLEVVKTAFSGLTFKLDDTTTSGMYLYTVELNRSMSCELSLKKLLRFIQISGKIYTENSWMVKRAMEIISKEDSNEKAKNIPLLSIEEKI